MHDLDRPLIDPGEWLLEPGLDYLNHGSFGACPRAVLAFQQQLREELEREPVTFLVRELEARLDAARARLARFLKADPDDLVFIPNATTGVNCVIQSLRLGPDAEVLLTNHEYNACRNAVLAASERDGFRCATARIPFPLQSEEEVMKGVLERITPATRLVLVDHVTSQTGLVFPVQRLQEELASRQIDLLVDGAHAPGMVAVDLQSLRAPYYTGNCHKWLCAPKGAAFLHVRRDRQERIRPVVISHGASSPRTDRSRFQIEFSWMGTVDPTAVLSVPKALDWMEAQVPGGWSRVMERNRELARAGRERLLGALRAAPPAPDGMVGSLASVPLPGRVDSGPFRNPLYRHPFQEQLWRDHRLEVPLIPWDTGASGQVPLIRISAAPYNHLAQYERLACLLKSFNGNEL